MKSAVHSKYAHMMRPYRMRDRAVAHGSSSPWQPRSGDHASAGHYAMPPHDMARVSLNVSSSELNRHSHQIGGRWAGDQLCAPTRACLQVNIRSSPIAASVTERARHHLFSAQPELGFLIFSSIVCFFARGAEVATAGE